MRAVWRSAGRAGRPPRRRPAKTTCATARPQPSWHRPGPAGQSTGIALVSAKGTRGAGRNAAASKSPRRSKSATPASSKTRSPSATPSTSKNSPSPSKSTPSPSKSKNSPTPSKTTPSPSKSTPTPSKSKAPRPRPRARRPTPSKSSPSPSKSSPSPNKSTPIPTKSPTPKPSKTKSPSPSPSPTPSRKTSHLCVSVQPLTSKARVHPGSTATYVIWVWSTRASTRNVTVGAAIGQASGIGTPRFSVCPSSSGATCALGSLPRGQADELQAQVAGVAIRASRPSRDAHRECAGEGRGFGQRGRHVHDRLKAHARPGDSGCDDPAAEHGAARRRCRQSRRCPRRPSSGGDQPGRPVPHGLAVAVGRPTAWRPAARRPATGVRARSRRRPPRTRCR